MIDDMRPNILFAVMDDGSHTGATGCEFVNTPNFDWIAKNGVLFTEAYTTNPKCAPSRASICTGMHTWQLKDACCHSVVTFPKEFATYQEILAGNHYHVGYTGKGWAPGKWDTTRQWNPAGPCYNDFHLTPPEKTNISSIDYVRNFRKFLDEKREGQPFSFWFGSKEPHRHYVAGEGLRNGKKLEDIKTIPDYFPNLDIVKSDLLDYAYEIDYFDLQLGKMLDLLREYNELDNTIIVVTSDNGCPFPRIKGQMYQQDFNLPLAIYWPQMMAEGRVCEELVSFVDFAPTFIEAAGLECHEQFCGKSLIELMIDNDNSEKNNVPFRDFVTMGRENHDAGREGDLGYPVRAIRKGDYLYIRNFEPDRWPAGNPETHFGNCDGSPTKDVIIRLNEVGKDYYYKLAFGKRPLEELYNIKADPQCMINLALIDTYGELKNDLWKALQGFLIETKDPRINGQKDYFDSFVVNNFKEKYHSWHAYSQGDFKLPDYLNWKLYALSSEKEK